MFHKLQGVFPMEDFVLGCKFRNGAIKLYDIKPLIREISAFAYFTEHPEAFKQVSISPGGNGITFSTISTRFFASLAKAITPFAS